MRSEGTNQNECECVTESVLHFFVFVIVPLFPPACFRNLANSAMLRCASGRLRTLPLRPPPLPQLPQLPQPANRCVSCGWTRPRSRAPAAALETSRRKATTGRGDGSSRRAGHHVNVTLKAITAVTAPEALGASSSGTRDAHLQPDATPRKGVTGTLAKSRISHQYRQSKKKTKKTETWYDRKKMYEYMNIYNYMKMINIKATTLW